MAPDLSEYVLLSLPSQNEPLGDCSSLAFLHVNDKGRSLIGSSRFEDGMAIWLAETLQGRCRHTFLLGLVQHTLSAPLTE